MSPFLPEPGHLPRAYRIREVRVETPTIRSFILDGQTAAQPGQFVMAWLPGLDEKPLSLSGSDPIVLTVDRHHGTLDAFPKFQKLPTPS